MSHLIDLEEADTGMYGLGDDQPQSLYDYYEKGKSILDKAKDKARDSGLSVDRATQAVKGAVLDAATNAGKIILKEAEKGSETLVQKMLVEVFKRFNIWKYIDSDGKVHWFRNVYDACGRLSVHELIPQSGVLDALSAFWNNDFSQFVDKEISRDPLFNKPCGYKVPPQPYTGGPHGPSGSSGAVGVPGHTAYVAPEGYSNCEPDPDPRRFKFLICDNPRRAGKRKRVKGVLNGLSGLDGTEGIGTLLVYGFAAYVGYKFITGKR
jgi:hypothetical protein